VGGGKDGTIKSIKEKDETKHEGRVIKGIDRDSCPWNIRGGKEKKRKKCRNISNQGKSVIEKRWRT